MAQLLGGYSLLNMWVVYQIGIAKTPPFGMMDHAGHLVDGIPTAVVVAPLELADVAAQVLRTHAVVDAHVPAHEHQPERLDAVDVDLVVHILADAVVHAFAVGEASIGSRLIGVNPRGRLRVVSYEAAQRRARLRAPRRWPGRAPWHGHLVHASTPGQAIALACVHVLGLAAHERLVSFDGASHLLGRCGEERGSEPVG
jgi:hypothetical protein